LWMKLRGFPCDRSRRRLLRVWPFTMLAIAEVINRLLVGTFGHRGAKVRVAIKNVFPNGLRQIYNRIRGYE
jgi:hypothetical protein